MKKAGFSLVELLIAATIIALLAGIGVTSYSALTIQSRNSRRKADLENLRSALELYRADNDYYPEELSTLESENYLTKLMDDPKSGRNYVYCPTGEDLNFTDYSLYASLEGEGDTISSCEGDCGDTACNYQLTPLGEE
jgi:general secretion pathway protein G